MHHAPAVSFPLGRSRFLAVLLCAVWLTGAGVVALWCAQQAHFGWRQGLGVVALVVGALLALRWWRMQREGVLHWDGESWQASFVGLTVTGRVSVHLDLQRQLWLKLHGTAPPSDHWLWLERDANPPAWRDLRRAVYSRAKDVTADA